MDTIRITHPRLDGRVIEVPAESLPHHAAAGWVPADQLTEAPEPAATPAPDVPTTEPKRRVRTTKESD